MNDAGQVDLARIKEVLARYPNPNQSDLIPILQDTQEAYRYLPEPAMREISRVTKIPLSRIFGVATFYAQFSFHPRAKYTIRCCRGTACHVKGAPGIIGAIKRTLGIQEGESTSDMLFHLETVACLGTCFLAPVMMVNDEYFGNLTPKQVETIVRDYQSAKA